MKLHETRINTERLTLRRFTKADTADIYCFSQEEGMKRWIPDQVYHSMEEAGETLDFLISMYGEYTDKVQYLYVLGVEIKETRQLIGHVGLSAVDAGIEIGYAIGDAFQKRGFAGEAVAAFSDWAKNTLKLSVVYGIVDHDNTASIKTLETAGFIHQKDETHQGANGVCHRKIYLK